MGLPRFLEDVVSGKVSRDRKPKKQEKATAKALGGRVQPGSGARGGFKGDVRDVVTPLVEFLIECKRTEGSSIRIQAQWLNKITTEAGPMRDPALAIQFEADVLQKIAEPDQIVAESDWIAVPRSVFKRLLDAVVEVVGEDE